MVHLGMFTVVFILFDPILKWSKWFILTNFWLIWQFWKIMVLQGCIYHKARIVTTDSISVLLRGDLCQGQERKQKKEDHVFFSPNGFFRPHRIFLSEQLFFVWSVFFCSGDWQNKNKAADCSFPGSQDTSFDWFDWKHLLGKQNAQRTKYEIGMRCSNQNAETGVWEQVSASNGFSNYLALCVLRSFSKPLPLPKGTVGGEGKGPLRKNLRPAACKATTTAKKIAPFAFCGSKVAPGNFFGKRPIKPPPAPPPTKKLYRRNICGKQSLP